MQIHLRNRVNKISPNEIIGGEFIIFDNANEIQVSKSIGCERKDFIQIRRSHTKENKIVVHKMLKTPEYCDKDELYHYNSISWKDRITNELHILFFDTVVFLCNDEGKTQQKIEG